MGFFDLLRGEHLIQKELSPYANELASPSEVGSKLTNSVDSLTEKTRARMMENNLNRIAIITLTAFSIIALGLATKDNPALMQSLSNLWGSEVSPTTFLTIMSTAGSVIGIKAADSLLPDPGEITMDLRNKLTELFPPKK